MALGERVVTLTSFLTFISDGNIGTSKPTASGVYLYNGRKVVVE